MTYQEISRKGWNAGNGTGATMEDIKLGALLRIAEALEKMGVPYDNMIRDRDYQKRRKEELQGSCDRLNRSNAALRGHLKRLKK